MDKRILRSKKVRPGPYDRQNQSILGKVCSTVKGLLNPSWLLNVSQWMSNSEEEQPGGSSDDIEEETIREDNDVVCPSVSHGSKRLRLRFDDHVPSIQSSGTQTWPEQLPQTLYETISRVQSPSTQSSLIENKETIAVLNGDDHSENSEGSASTSGCSSLVSSHKESNRLNENPFVNLNSRKRKLSSSKSGLNDLSSRRALWSTNFSPKLQRRLPTISHTNQPSFNLSTFVGPSKLNESVEKKVSSPFYEGRTMFGGASASRRMPSTVSPYQVDRSLKNKIRVREHNSDDSLEGMSSAAKRILLTLEKMSTPVADAKKIPNSDTSPVDMSLYLTPPKSRRNSQLTPSLAGKGPPIANINTIAKLKTLKNYGASRLRNTLLLSSPSESKIEKSDLQPKPFVIGSPGDSEQPISKSLPKETIPIPTSCDLKIQNKTDLLPKPFVFSSPIEHELPNSSLPKGNIPLSSTISSQIEKNSDLQLKSFVFSNPIEHELPNNNAVPKENISIPFNNVSSTFVSPTTTWECSSCWIRNPHSRKTCAACEAPQFPKDSTPVLKFNSSEGTKSSPVVSTSMSVTSSGFNFGNAVSSSNFKFGNSSLPTFTFGSAKTNSQSVTPSKPLTFGSDSNTSMWECDACWVRNPEVDTKCKACETPRPQKEHQTTTNISSSVPDSFSTWECTSCWVRNPMKEKKCMACETLHPNADKSSALMFKSFDKPTTTSPVCPTTTQSTVTSSTLNVSTTVSTSSVNFVFGVPKSDAQQNIPTLSFRSGLDKAQIPSASATPQSASVPTPVSSESCDLGTTKTESQITTALKVSFGSVSKSKNEEEFKNASVSTAVSSAGFSFGNLTSSPAVCTFGSSKIESESGTATKPFSFGLGSNALTWECSTCLIKNPESESKCKACETVRPSKNNTSAKGGFAFKNEATSSVLLPITQSATTGHAVGTTMPVSSGGFVFGAEKDSSASSFIFGSGLEKPQTSVTPASQSATSALTSGTSTPVPAAGFVFGTPKTEAPTSFSFSSDHDKPQTTPSVPSLISPAAQGLNVSASTTIRSGGFVFGIPKTEGQNSTATPFTFGSGSNVSTWECSTCLIKNPESESKCKACETVRCLKSNTSAKGGFTFKNEATSSVLLPTTQSATSGVAAGNAMPVSSGGFVFGAVKAEKDSSSPFIFGSGLEKPQTSSVTSASQSATSALTSSTSTPVPSAGFVFGTPKTEAHTSFSFSSGHDKPQTTPSIPSLVSHSAAQGLNVSTSTTVPSGGFVFGIPKTEAQNSTAIPFTFGAVTSSSNTSAFSAFQPPQPANPTFKFGSQSAGSTAPTIGMSSNFSFAKSETSNQIPSSVSQNPVSAFGPTNTNFVFGSKSDTSNQIPSTVSQAPGIAFGTTTNFTFSGKNEGNSTSQPPAPSFGSSAIQSVFGSSTPVQSFGGTDKPGGGGFNFGGATSGVFQFGASNNTEKKRTATASGFFGTPSAPETNNTFSTGFNMSTPPSFNFGATSTPAAGPFQFAASTAPKPTSAQTAPRKIRKALRRVPRKD